MRLDPRRCPPSCATWLRADSRPRTGESRFCPSRGAGLGRALAAAARHLVPGGSPLWAQIAPANAASVRAFLAAGYKLVGAEAHLACRISGA